MCLFVSKWKSLLTVCEPFSLTKCYCWLYIFKAIDWVVNICKTHIVHEFKFIKEKPTIDTLLICFLYKIWVCVEKRAYDKYSKFKACIRTQHEIILKYYRYLNINQCLKSTYVTIMPHLILRWLLIFET